MEVAVFALVPILAVFAAVTWIVWQVLKGLRFVVVNLFRGVGSVGGGVFRFVRRELVEVIQFVGAVFTLIVLLPLTLLNFVIGRWSTAKHYGRAVEDELVSAGLGLYRLALGNPLRLVGLGGMLDGVERRIPEVVDRAPRRTTARGALQFDGYDVVGTMPAGGSGAQLYLARPKPDTFERLTKAGRSVPGEVVIKSFALVQGSTLPQIVRESRALEAANRLGLVLEHHLDSDRFYYVMEYVRGEDLDMVVQRMHQRTGPEGLGDRELRLALGYAMDLLKSLDRFHTGGLWHKDVKPANLIVSGERAHLVDFGLVTPLQSALTLTTHGTEYYRDPEMVRLAMQGVKVHEVDGVKFDLYSAGAVLYSMVENSFPAHGSLSRISLRCPEALAWIVRRSMADIASRYGTAWEMLDDLAAVASAPDPFSLRPADLPSVQRGATRERSPFYAFADDAPAVGRVVAESAAPTGLRPYLLADQPRPVADDARRRRRRRVLVAVGASSAAILVVMTGLARELRSRAHVHDGRDLALLPSEVRAYQAGRAIVEERMGRGADQRVDLQSRVHGHGTPRAERTGAKVPEGERSLEDSFASGTRALVLDDLASPAGRGVVQREEERLRERGLAIVGADETDVFAGVRMAVGTGHVQDEDAMSRLQEYLNDSTDIDLIVWVAADAKPTVLVRSGLTD